MDATIVVATSGAFYEKNPLLVKRFLEAQAEIAQYMKDNGMIENRVDINGLILKID